MDVWDFWRVDNLTRFWLKRSKKHYKEFKEAASSYKKVESLDKCLSAHEEYEKYMHRLGRPVPPEREAFFEKAKPKRERYAQEQKVQEDKESFERISSYFA